MQRYFITKEEYDNKKIINDFHHIKNVMRMNVNDEIITMFDNKAFVSKITTFTTNCVSYEEIEEITTRTELNFTIDLAQGYAKGDKMDYIVQKATELGVSGIYPIFMKRSIVKLDSQKALQKQERFQKIAKEAAEQSHRNVVPVIYSINELVKIDFSNYDVKMVCYEEQANDDKSVFKTLVENIEANQRVLFLIGPEGGIDEKEVDYLEKQGFIKVGLGPRILRTETASQYVLSAISYAKELII